MAFDVLFAAYQFIDTLYELTKKMEATDEHVKKAEACLAEKEALRA